MSSPSPTLYFAYGSNLSLVQMRARCPTATYLGLGVLRNWTWIINARGYANIISSPPSPSSSSIPPPTPPSTNLVYGLIYTLTPEDEALLDGFEGVPWSYKKEMVPVEVFEHGPEGNAKAIGLGTEGGVMMQVMAYVDRERVEKGVIKEEYIGRMQRGCREAWEKGVPRVWMEKVMGEWFEVRLEGEGQRD